MSDATSAGSERAEGLLPVGGRARRRWPRALLARWRRAAGRLDRDIDFRNVTYFLSQMTIVPGDEPGMSTWRKKHAAASPADYFGLPRDRIVTIGSHTHL